MSTDRGACIWTSVLGIERASAALAFLGAATFLVLGATDVDGARFLAVFPAVLSDFSPVVLPACFSGLSDFSSGIRLSVVNNEDYTNAQFSTPERPAASVPLESSPGFLPQLC
jgi:hypothetical protein